MARLILHPGTSRARAFELKSGANTLGRDPENDISIQDVTISGAHAQITVDGPNVTVADLSSSNGTFIDREPIIESPIQSGQLLRLGGVEMLFESDEPLPAESSQTTLTTSQPARIRTAEPPLAPRIPTPSSAPVGAPPMAPRIPTIAPVAADSAKKFCRFHPKSFARWQCPQCGQFYCELCVNSRRVEEGQGYFCRPCGVQCSPVAAPVSILPEPDDENFYTQLPGAFLYPFKSGVAFVLVVMAIFFSFMEFVLGFFGCLGLGLQAFSLAYMFLYMQKIIQCSAQGENREPPMPDITNIHDDVLLPCLQLLGTIIFCFGPAIGLAIWSLSGGPAFVTWLIWPALALGCLYFPMAFLGVAMFDNLAALNPALAVSAMRKIPLEYLTACVCLAIVFTVRWFGHMALVYLIPIPVVPGFISDIIGLYFLTVQCRILGMLYYTNRYRLGWFRE